MIEQPRPTGRWTILALVGALAAGCNRGKDWCGPCEPGYGTLHVTTVFEDEYTESVNEGLGASMQLLIKQNDENFDDCNHFDSSTRYIDARLTELDFSRTYQVSEGWVCASTLGYGTSGKGQDYYNSCGAAFGPSRVRECACVDETLDVTCELEWDDGD